MKLLILLVLSITSVWSQQVCTAVKIIEQEDTHIVVQGTVSLTGQTARGVWMDFDSDTTLDKRSRDFGNSLDHTDVFAHVMGLAPATKYYGSFEADSDSGSCGNFTCTGTCTNCGSVDNAYFADSSGFNCDATSEPPNWTQPAEDSCVVAGVACLPTAPTHAYTTRPSLTIDGSSLTVNGTCTNLQTHLNTLGAADWSLNHEIIIPAGVECRPELETLTVYTLPCPTGLNPTGSGWKVIHSDADARLNPPFGSTIDPSFKPFMANLQHNETNWEWTGGVRSEAAPLVRQEASCSPNPTKGWYFENVHFEYPDPGEMPFSQTAVTAVDTADGDITAAGHGLENGERAWVSLPGIDNGVAGCWITNVVGDDFRCFIGFGGGPSGTYTTGGVVTQASEIALTTCTNTTPIQCDSTQADHGFRQPESQAITGYASAVIDMVDPSTTKLLQLGFSVTISGAPDAPYNAHHGISASSDTTDDFTLQTSGLTDTCVSSCGTVQRHLHMVISGVSGCTACNGNQVISVIDNNTIELIDTVASGAGTGGSIGAVSGKTNTMLSFSTNSDWGTGATDVILDRVVADAKQWTRPFLGLAFADQSISIFGSYFTNFSSECEYSNKAKILRQTVCPAGGNPGDGPNTFVTTGGQDQFVTGTLITNSPGIPIFFADDRSSTEQQPADFTFQYGTIFKSRQFTPGHPLDKGYFYAARHFVETKGSERIVFRGNHLDGSSANSDTPFGSFLLSPRGDSTGTFTRYIRDVDVQWNIWRDNNATMFMLDETNNKKIFPTMRVRWSNNLAIMTRYNGTTGQTNEAGRLTASPGLNLTASEAGIPGVSVNGVVNFTMKNNTILYAQSTRLNILQHGAKRNARVQVQNNIFGYAEKNAATHGCAGTIDGFGMNPKPANTTCKSSFEGWNRAEPTTDPNSFFKNNVILPVIHSPASGFDVKRRSLADGDTVRRDECDTYFAGLTGITCIGATGACAPNCPETANAREELLFQANSWQPETPTYDGKGVDFDSLADNTHYVGPVTVTEQAPTTIRLSYRAPVTGNVCRVDWTSDASFGASYWTNGGSTNDNGVGQDRTFDMTGLTPNDEYRYRIFCKGARTQILGLFTTAP